MSNQLMFHSTVVQPVKRNNQIWITSTELSKLLQYADSKSVTKIYSRNKDEFTDKMTMVVKLTTNGINNSLRKKSVRIFSLRGAHLIAMFASTNVAKEVRKWLLDLADKEAGHSQTRKDMIEVNRTNLICLVHHMLWLNDFYIDNRLYDVFKMLGSNFGIRIHDHFGDGAFVASMFKRQLEKKQLRQV
ncbi:BRO family protein [Gilliamella sp. Imp1-1]|uniref:BRO family protein n=1 Tax=Gilliamella sp. Imp1-1 TaxID=3120248 RepID=UPI0004613FB2|nr:BRO family protein [Gilliamella apicola]KDN11087.1 Phage Rha protein [Gilliamella apicola]OCG56763.1 hypothetical protein A9G38_09225 [Gilliamella apicola]